MSAMMMKGETKNLQPFTLLCQAKPPRRRGEHNNLRVPKTEDDGEAPPPLHSENLGVNVKLCVIFGLIFSSLSLSLSLAQLF